MPLNLERNLEQELAQARKAHAAASQLYDAGPGIFVGLELFLRLTQAEGAQNMAFNGTHRNLPHYCHTVMYGRSVYYAESRDALPLLNEKPLKQAGMLYLP